jgi:hypothetical protein
VTVAAHDAVRISFNCTFDYLVIVSVRLYGAYWNQRRHDLRDGTQAGLQVKRIRCAVFELFPKNSVEFRKNFFLRDQGMRLFVAALTTSAGTPPKSKEETRMLVSATTRSITCGQPAHGATRE